MEQNDEVCERCKFFNRYTMYCHRYPPVVKIQGTYITQQHYYPVNGTNAAAMQAVYHTERNGEYAFSVRPTVQSGDLACGEFKLKHIPVTGQRALVVEEGENA